MIEGKIEKLAKYTSRREKMTWLDAWVAAHGGMQTDEWTHDNFRYFDNLDYRRKKRNYSLFGDQSPVDPALLTVVVIPWRQSKGWEELDSLFVISKLKEKHPLL